MEVGYLENINALQTIQATLIRKTLEVSQDLNDRVLKISENNNPYTEENSRLLPHTGNFINELV